MLKKTTIAVAVVGGLLGVGVATGLIDTDTASDIFNAIFSSEATE